ncbi:MAG: hypothetical protein QM703_26265 [Gemmatales bacterium]
MDSIIYAFPWIAFAMAMFMVSLAFDLWYQGRWSFRSATFRFLVLSSLWLMYALYETEMKAWEKTVRNPIRVDLLMILPALDKATKVGYLSWFAARGLIGKEPQKEE